MALNKSQYPDCPVHSGVSSEVCPCAQYVRQIEREYEARYNANPGRFQSLPLAQYWKYRRLELRRMSLSSSEKLVLIVKLLLATVVLCVSILFLGTIFAEKVEPIQ